MLKITVQGHHNGSATVSGLRAGDLRLLAAALREGAFMGGDEGGPVSDAIIRFEKALRAPIGLNGHVVRERIEIAAATTDPNDLYEEIYNLEVRGVG